jgi:PPP family 3-phenylpropionic acid transporter
MVDSAVGSFASAFLLQRGFSSSLIGLVIGIGSIGSLFLEPVLAHYADHAKAGLTDILNVLVGLFILTAGSLLVWKSGSPALFVFYILINILHTIQHPLINEMNYRLERAGHTMNFGIARAMGSLGFSIMSALLGVLVEKAGVQMIPLSAIAISLVMAVLLFLLRPMMPKRDAVQKEAAETRAGSASEMLAFAKGHRRLMLVTLGGTFLMFSSVTCGYYLLQIIMHVGGNAQDMGIALALAAFTEIPVMMLFSRLQDRLSSGMILRIAAGGYILKQLTLLLARNYGMILFSQMFQMISFALFLPAIVAYAHEHTEAEDGVKGQALMPLSAVGSSLLASLFGGVLIDSLGIPFLLLVCLFTAVIGAVLVVRFTEIEPV